MRCLRLDLDFIPNAFKAIVQCAARILEAEVEIPAFHSNCDVQLRYNRWILFQCELLSLFSAEKTLIRQLVFFNKQFSCECVRYLVQCIPFYCAMDLCRLLGVAYWW